MTLDIDIKNRNVLSIHKEYSISQYNWTIEFFFKQDAFSKEESNSLRLSLQDLLDSNNRKKLVQLFSSETYNSAIAVSDSNDRRSIIILTQVSSLDQFVNSLTHEILHISRHIDECNNNEELFTILGNIAGDIIKELYSL